MSKLIETKKEAEKAFLVCTTIPKSSSIKSIKQKIYREHLDELEFLTQTAGAVVVDKFYQERNKIDSTFFIGRGKALEIAEKAQDENIDLVIFENSLTPTQVRNLEKIIKCKVIDKPALILDIFASNARTSEAKTQVELAQLQYLLPRLTRQWTHLSKQYGGIGTKGPGETQIETDRRLVKTRISVLKDKLNKIDKQRRTQRQMRDKFIRVALVGYTNTGKSTLLNTLTDSSVYVEDRLFATLDTSTKILKEINNQRLSAPILISDTVGFIRNLPHDLIESFKSTLAEVVESDVLLHIADISSENIEEQIQVVNSTLEELNVHHKECILIFNKVDKINREKTDEMLSEVRSRYPKAIFISAIKGINLDSIYKSLIEIINKKFTETEIRLPLESADVYKIINQIHNKFDILETKYFHKSVRLRIKADRKSIESLIKQHKIKINNKTIHSGERLTDGK